MNYELFKSYFLKLEHFNCEVLSSSLIKNAPQARVILLKLRSDDTTSLPMNSQLLPVSLRIKAKAALKIHPTFFISLTQESCHLATLVSLLLLENSPGLFLPQGLCTCCFLCLKFLPPLSPHGLVPYLL